MPVHSSMNRLPNPRKMDDMSAISASLYMLLLFFAELVSVDVVSSYLDPLTHPNVPHLCLFLSISVRLPVSLCCLVIFCPDAVFALAQVERNRIDSFVRATSQKRLNDRIPRGQTPSFFALLSPWGMDSIWSRVNTVPLSRSLIRRDSSSKSQKTSATKRIYRVLKEPRLFEIRGYGKLFSQGGNLPLSLSVIGPILTFDLSRGFTLKKGGSSRFKKSGWLMWDSRSCW